MNERLKEVFDKALTLSDEEQAYFGELFLAELEDELEWKRKFEQSQDLLQVLADQARREHREGKTIPMDDLIS